MLSIRKGLALTLVAAMALAGCGGSATKSDETKSTAPAAPEAKKDPVKITFWHGMNPESAHGKALQALVKQFNESQKEVIVEETYQGAYGDLEKKLTGAVASQTPPTVVQATDSMLTTLVKSKAVQDITAQISKEKADYGDGLFDALTFDGKIYALPFNKSVLVTIYDKGVVKTPPKNWEEFRKIAKEVTKDKMYGTAFPADVYYFGQFFAQAGGEWVSKDGKTATFNSEAGVQALQFIVDMVKDGSAVQLKPKEYASNYFNEGRAAIIPTTSASFAFITHKNYGVAPLFAGPKNDKVPLSGANVALLSGIKPEESEAGIKFMLWLTGKEAQLKWAMDKTGYMPVRKSAIADQKWVDFVKANPEYQVLGESLNKGVTQPNLPQWGNVQKEITTAVEAAVLGKATPKAALDEAVKKANELLAK